MHYDRFGQPLNLTQESDQQVDDFEHIKQVAKELYDEWNHFSYGIPVKGEIKDMSGEYYDKHYKLLSPEEFEKYGGGTCWDYVAWGNEFLKDKDVNVRTFYIWTETPPNWTTHSFLVIDCGDMNRYVYIESSFDILKGVWIHNSMDEIIDTITWNLFKCSDNDRRFDQFRYVVFEYTGSHPEYGCTSKQYMNWMADHAKVIKEGYAKKDQPPSGIVNEGAWYYNVDRDEIVVDLLSYTKKIDGDTFFEIDELIVPLIRICNKKGYKTRYCCSGHIPHHEIYGNDYSNRDTCDIPYIMFDKPFKFKNIPPMWNLEGPNTNKTGPYVILRFKKYPVKYFPRGSNPSQHMDWYKEIVNGIQALCKYFEKLPDASEMELYDDSEIKPIQEAKIPTKDRNELDDSDFGLVYTDENGNKIRKYPLTDERHVLQAVRFFNKAPDEYKEELARNIVKRAKQLDMEWENWESLKPYLPKHTQESTTSNGLTNARLIASRIHQQTKKDSKPPTGNQNCQICTWCAEENFRGGTASPRPVYSPRDPVFNVNGWDIVIKPNKTPIKNKDDVIKKITLSGEGSRWYTHVKWKDGHGGHEFLLLNLNGNVYVMDAQQGVVENVTSKEGSEYFDDITYKESFICRLDNKEFNHELFKKNNDPSKILPWDEKLDIPYMKKEGLLSEEDDIQDLQMESYQMESAWQDIRNGVNPKSKKLFFHVSRDDNLDGKTLTPRVPAYLSTQEEFDRDKDPYFEETKTPRVCFSNTIEGCLNAMISAGDRVATGGDELYVYIPVKPITSYKTKMNKDLVKDKDVFDAKSTGEIWVLEPVQLRLYGTIMIDQVSNHKLVDSVNKAGKVSRITYKWHWQVKPKVIKKMDVDIGYFSTDYHKNKQSNDKPVREGYSIPESYKRIQSFLEGDYDAFNE